MIALLVYALMVTTSGPAQAIPPHKAAAPVMICGQSGGVNNGIYVASCLPGMKLLRPSSMENAQPLALADGTFVHDFVFEAPKVESWETTLCAPGLLDFNIAGLSGLSISMKKLEAGQPNCITRQFVNVSGVFSFVIHTAGPHPRIQMRTVFIPVVPNVLAHYPPASASAVVETVPNAAYMPVMIPPPPTMSMPVIAGSAHSASGSALSGVGGGVISIPVTVAH